MIRVLSLLLCGLLCLPSWGATANYTITVDQLDRSAKTSTGPALTWNNENPSIQLDTFGYGRDGVTRSVWRFNLYNGTSLPGYTSDSLAARRIDRVQILTPGAGAAGMGNALVCSPFGVYKILAPSNQANWFTIVEQEVSGSYLDVVPGVHIAETPSATKVNGIIGDATTGRGAVNFDSRTSSAIGLCLDMQSWCRNNSSNLGWMIVELTPHGWGCFRPGNWTCQVTYSTNPEGDLNDDGVVNSADLTQFDAWFGGQYHGYADMDDDGDMDTTDRALVNAAIAASGDVNADGLVNAADIDAFQALVRNQTYWATLDYNNNGQLDNSDINLFYTNLLQTKLGDVNFDCHVDNTDRDIINANLFTSGKFWSQGDLNNDGNVDTYDYNLWNALKFLPCPCAA